MSLYIPPKVKVGVIKRDDTFEGKLAYIIPSEKSGKKFRQEEAWEGWLKHNNELERFELDNVPSNGYFFNKSIKRVSYSSFGSTVQKMRIYNQRGFEFEIDMKTVAMIAQSCDISKGEILQECILAWDGKNIVLLPVTSLEYFEIQKEKEKIIEHKEAIKEMKNGASISLNFGDIYSTTVNKNFYIYLGKGRDIDYESAFGKAKCKDLVYTDDGCHLKVNNKEQDLFVECYWRDEDRLQVYSLSAIKAFSFKNVIPTGKNICNFKNQAELKNMLRLKPAHLNVGGNDLIPISDFAKKNSGLPFDLSYLHQKYKQEIRKNKNIKSVSFNCFVLNNVEDLVEVNVSFFAKRDSVRSMSYMSNMVLTCRNTKTGLIFEKKLLLDNSSYGNEFGNAFPFDIKSTRINKVFELKKTIEV